QISGDGITNGSNGANASDDDSFHEFNFVKPNLKVNPSNAPTAKEAQVSEQRYNLSPKCR
ncbi:MAG: hypothetical protein LH618_00565, partial [Saprospiraceae bacterium]|nr:hypothetical protein [Saprospiraceae bacterium]